MTLRCSHPSTRVISSADSPAPPSISRRLAFGFLGVPFAFAYSLEADKDRYLLVAHWTAALLAACGGGAALSALDRLSRPRPSIAHTGRGTRVASIGLATVLIALAGWDAWNARGTVAIDRDLTARRFITSTERISTPDAIIVAPWIYAMPLAYAAYVEHSFGHRIIVTAEAASLRRRMAAWSSRSCVVACPIAVRSGCKVCAPLAHFRSVHRSSSGSLSEPSTASPRNGGSLPKALRRPPQGSWPARCGRSSFPRGSQKS